MTRYVIIGGGIAGISATAKIRERDTQGETHFLTEEAYPFYSRIRLPEILAGAASPAEAFMRGGLRSGPSCK